MNPSLLEHFAAHEQISENLEETPVSWAEELAGPLPVRLSELIKWNAKWRAKLRFIRARAMVEEAERRQPVNKDMPHMNMCPFHDTWMLGGDCQFCRKHGTEVVP